MNDLSKFLVESIMEADGVDNIVVVYAGRFQPFHKGHYATYQHLVKKFGKDNVYIGTSNKTDNVKSPFNFSEKKMIITTMFDIPSNKIVEIKNPYKPVEILKKFPENTAFITVVGKKDSSRLGGKYFIPYKDNIELQNYTAVGYIYVAPEQNSPISGTDIRKGLKLGKTDEKQQFFKKAYNKFNQKIFDLLVDKISKLSESVDYTYFIPKQYLENWIVENIDFIKESSKTDPANVDDGPNFLFPNYSTFDLISKKRAEKVGYEVIAQIMSDKLTDIDPHPIYPHGPVKAVTPYPAGVIGKTTATNQKDYMETDAYKKWYSHIKRIATMIGFKIIDDMHTVSDFDSFNYGMNVKSSGIHENIVIPVKVGDTILTGKFKNKKVVVKTIGTDDRGMPTINGKKVVNFRLVNEGTINEIPMADLIQIDKYADTQLNPVDIVLTGKHFFDRLKDPRNKKEITTGELIRFFKQLGKNKQEFLDFLNKYNQIVATDEKTKINIPFMKKANKAIAKTVMRKNEFMTSNPKIKFETIGTGYPSKEQLEKLNTKLKKIRTELDKESDGYTKICDLNEAVSTLKLNLPKDVILIHKAFKANGKKLYLVGGSVRDAILGKSPKDFDLATDAKPDEVIEIAKKHNLHYTEVGKSFGVVVVKDMEIATFRKDLSSGRRPDAVEYTDIYDDVKRRDLTINALFYDIDRKEIVDLVGGIKDLKNNTVRTVGNAIDRFEEDPLRKLRALRFAARLGSKIDKDTLQALQSNPSLNGVSPERIRDEFIKSIQSAKSVKNYLMLSDSTKLLQQIFPNIQYKKSDFIEEQNYIILIAYLFRNKNGKDIYKYLMDLKYTNNEATDISYLIKLSKFTPANVFLFKKLQENTKLSDNDIIKWGKLIGINFSKFVKFKLSVKGSDVMGMGFKGKEIGQQISKLETDNYLKEIVSEGSDIATLSSGNNSARWTPTGKKRKLGIEQLSGYEQIDFPTADNVSIDNEKDKWVSVSKTAKYHNKVRAKRSSDGNLVLKESDNSDIKKYKEGLIDLKNAIQTGKSGMNNSDMIKLYYQNALKFGVDNKFIDNPLRLMINKHNKKNFTLGGISTKEAAIIGIDLILNKLKENVNSVSLYEIITNIQNTPNSKSLLLCGGSYGHMNHPFDTDINLTFGQLKDIVKKALTGKLEFTREKTDGVAISVSWKDGKLIAARNKGHLKNKGENALDINGITNKFKGRGELEKAYTFAMQDLSNAISKLSDKQKKKIFNDGSSFMNLEVIYPTSINVIPYGQALLVFHGTMDYDLDGNVINQDQSSGKMLAGMIKQINQNVQANYTIQGPPVVELPKNKNLESKQSKYLSQISKLQNEFKLKDSDGVSEYHQAWWSNWIDKNAPVKVSDKVREGLIKRWAFYDKSFRLISAEIDNTELLQWAQKVEKQDHKKISKDNLRKFEDIFLAMGADILSFMGSVLAVNPEKAVRQMRDRIIKTISDIEKSGNTKDIEKLKLELERLNAAGGLDKLAPSEGIVFTYEKDGHPYTMKLTGTFASSNQLLGIMYH